MAKNLTIDLKDDLCRICFSKKLLINIFKTKKSIMISSSIMSLAKVHICPNDGMPNTICSKCFQRLEKCIKFVTDCESSDFKLRKLTAEIGSNDLDSVNNVLTINVNESNSNDDYPKLVSEKTKHNEEKIIKPQCFTCGRVLSSRSRLKTHLLTHSGEKPFSCATCNKSFALKQNLSVHMRTHTGEKPHQCKICGKRFAQSAGLTTHKRKHTGRKPYQCALCPTSFTTWGHLQYHIRKHTGEKKFECDVCGRCFIARNDLKRHLSTHTGIKPHVCCICGIQMSRAYHLKRHMQYAHGEDKKISCSTCSARFCKKADLDRHTKSLCVAKEQDL